jgi:NAD(P)-dependent dehydrogenase (short-subunit alcohol dehydrogenase family)
LNLNQNIDHKGDSKMAEKKQQFPKQRQEQPGTQDKMKPKPRTEGTEYKSAGKLAGKAALITGGDSGIGRAVAIAFAKEGADVSIAYLSEHKDATETKSLVEKQGRRCEIFAGDIGIESFCREVVQKTVDILGRLDILVNNAAEQHERDSIEEISSEELLRTFQTNLFSMFYLVKASLPHMKKGSSIINSTSITAYAGHPKLLDYATTKGGIVAFTRSLSLHLAERGVRVNGVAPGPVWTPLIPATFGEEHVASFGANTPMGRAGQPEEIAPCYVFLASDDSSYMSGQVLHPNGGRIVNG